MSKEMLSINVRFSHDNEMVELVGESETITMTKLKFIQTFYKQYKDLCIKLIEGHIQAIRDELNYISDPSEKEKLIKSKCYEFIKILKKIKG